MITGDQVKAARKLLGWTRTRLANRAKLLTAYTVLKAEDGAPGSPPTEVQWKAMREALESAGVDFIDGEAPGVRLRKR